MNTRERPTTIRPLPSAERIDELRWKYDDVPEPYCEWQDIAADDAGMPRFGEL